MTHSQPPQARRGPAGPARPAQTSRVAARRHERQPEPIHLAPSRSGAREPLKAGKANTGELTLQILQRARREKLGFLQAAGIACAPSPQGLYHRELRAVAVEGGALGRSHARLAHSSTTCATLTSRS